ncbi:2',3'-cyclic-nucleotide 3'-phosphodiesterase [Conger conger]|uniref:2',3'-cyclic-nucleotide 3'-phosphodiesterase n=1 Tax=Conger conger TaxID=82655 RepID=UPI002A5AB320|nr:2',3'-cyclic-nucleotide 3'-phosphodiesterase [Conger conger]XP_061089309.1 2',3'-cyclic-nucleotide 3'-phosphodiesterase [Conger conger]
MEGLEAKQTESMSLMQDEEQQKPVEEKQEAEEPESQKEKPQFETEPKNEQEKQPGPEPERMLVYETQKLSELGFKQPSPVKQPEVEKQLELDNLKPDAENQLEPDPAQQSELSPVKEPELSPMKEPELSPMTEPELSPMTEPELSPVKEPELSPVKEPELSPVKEPELSPVKEPELSPVKEPELSPVKEPELSPVKEPELSPVKEPELSPVKEPELSPVKEPELSPVKEPELSPVKEPELSPVTEPELSPVTEPELSHVKVKEPKVSPVKELAPEPEHLPELEHVKEPKAEQPEPSPVKQPEPEKQVDSGPEKVPEAEKQTENQPESEETEAEKQAESSPGMQEEPDQQASEVETPAPIVPGSLAFAILEDEHTKTALCTSRTLIILRGLPGSGKSRLAGAIRDHYQSFCTIVSADDHDVKPESPSVEGHKAMDEAVIASCTTGTAVVVVDDTNHAHGRVARLVELAEKHQYYTLFLEPRTEWGQDVEQLVQKTNRGLDKSQIQALKGQLEEVSMPLFFGWFLCPAFQDKLRSMAKDFLKTLQGLEAFKEHLSDFTGEAEKEVDLEQYFQDKGMLHCTTKFCDYGKADGSKEYAEQQIVKDRYGSMSELKLSTLVLTPRTLGARVSLTEDQLRLWPAGAEKEGAPEADLPPGSRAHITLGCAEGVEPVQTGLDLLELVLLQQQGQEGERAQDLDLGSLAYYGKGVWVLSLHEPGLAPACFCSYYGPKKEDGKKEAEKKKKFKCNLQ